MKRIILAAITLLLAYLPSSLSLLYETGAGPCCPPGNINTLPLEFYNNHWDV